MDGALHRAGIAALPPGDGPGADSGCNGLGVVAVDGARQRAGIEAALPPHDGPGTGIRNNSDAVAGAGGACFAALLVRPRSRALHPSFKVGERSRCDPQV